jgi:hypothetical protein
MAEHVCDETCDDNTIKYYTIKVHLLVFNALCTQNVLVSPLHFFHFLPLSASPFPPDGTPNWY